MNQPLPQGSILHHLAAHALANPAATVFTVLRNGEEMEQQVSYTQLWQAVQSLSASLDRQQLEGKTALLIYQEVIPFIVALLACQLSGIVPVPVSYVKGKKQVARLWSIMENAQTAAICCCGHSVDALQQGMAGSNIQVPVLVLPTDTLTEVGEIRQRPLPSGESIALIQYTSGSTGNPKGVVITHSNLLHNQQLLQQTFGGHSQSVIFSWLPFHHDMGLIGNILHTIYLGCTCVLMSPIHFIQKPLRWLQGVSKYKATHSGGPDFAYRLCAENISEQEAAQLDLSTWQVAYNGSEPVRYKSLQQFERVFRLAGFNRKAFHPCYGLAEATLLVAGQQPVASPFIITVAEDLTPDGKVRFVKRSDPAARWLVSAGKVSSGMEVFIRKTDGMRGAPMEVGEICIGGQSVTSGYYHHQNEELFHEAEGKRWLRTGDLGFLYKGALFIHGRIREMLIVRGRNIYPYDIEEMIVESHEAIASGGAVLFSLQEMSEEVVVVAELKRSHAQQVDHAALINMISQVVIGVLGCTPYDIILTTPAGIPRTTSGKRQRVLSRSYYHRQSFTVLAAKGQTVIPVLQPDNSAQLLQVVRERGDELSVRQYVLHLLQRKTGQQFREPLPDTTELTAIGLDSIQAMELINTISKELQVYFDPTKLFADNTIGGLIALLRSVNEPGAATAIPLRAVQEHYPLSGAQQRLWVLSQQPGASAAYHIVTRLLLQGPVNAGLLTEAFRASVHRHESLRTVFRLYQGEPRQVIRHTVAFELVQEDLSKQADVHASIVHRIQELTIQPFNLERGPLMRAHLIKIAEDTHALILVLHHIISDGWSVLVLLKEVMASYAALQEGSNTAGTVPLPIQHKDYIQWNENALYTPAADVAKDFWAAALKERVEPLQWPADHPRPEKRSFRGAILKHYLEDNLGQRIYDFCAAQQVTRFHFFRAFFTLLIGKLTGQDTITIGTAVSGRRHADLESQIGLYINTVPLLTGISWKISFVTFLHQLAAQAREVLEHQHYPFDKMLEVSDQPIEPGRSPLFDVMLSVQDIELHSTNQGGSPVFTVHSLDHYLNNQAPVCIDQVAAKFDLSFQAGIEAGKDSFIEIEYSTDLFTHERIRQWWTILEQGLQQVLTHPTQSLESIEWVSPEEKKKQLEDFNDTVADFPRHTTITQLWEEQVATSPDKIAVTAGATSLSYRDLDKHANQLAAWLRKHYAIERNDRIAIQLDRTEWMLVAILGIIKAGAAYVPVDPAFPEERTKYIVENSGSKVLINQQALARFQATAHQYAPHSLPAINEPGDLLYVIYTSGSTGKPKGCMLEHRGVINRLTWMWQQYGFSTSSVILQKTNYTFDVSVWEIFMPLIHGASLVLSDAASAGAPEKIASLIEQNGVTCLHFVPGMLQTFIATLFDNDHIKHRLRSLQSVIVSGEALLPETVAQWYRHVSIPLHNLYGPTEASVDVTHYTTRPGDTKIYIGKPIWNTLLYILDPADRLLPIGVAGELCIGGIGLARGYVQQPTLTAERFTPDPFRPGERIYRTGDLGRWTADGQVEFLGRKDQQLKIRGFRIEPGEIESALLQHAAVRETVVIGRKQPDGANELIAYIVGEHLPDQDQLRAFLSVTLPAYMIPLYFVELGSLPLTSSGKIDKRQLPDPSLESRSSGTAYKVPGTPVEVKLAAIWREVLGRERIGIKDDFFSIGGHSLRAARLLSRICKVFEIELELKDLLSTPVLEAQALLIEQARRVAFVPIPVAALQTEYALSSSQRRLWVLSQFEDTHKAYNMPGAYVFTGALQPILLQQAFDMLVDRHESLRTNIKENEQGDPVQIILPSAQAGFAITSRDLRGVEERSAQLHTLLLEDFTTAFQLDKGPLLRAALYQVADDKWILSYVMHHIVSDGWSLGILLQELLKAYRQLAQDDIAPFEPLRIQYKDYVAWHKEQYTSTIREAHKQYWLQQLSGELPVTEMPGQKQRPAIKTYRGAIVTTTIPASLVKPFNEIVHRQQATLFMGLMALVNVLLYRYTFQEDQLIGTPVAGRDHVDLEDQVGFYTNTLALRVQGRGAESFNEWIKKVAVVVTGAFSHQAYQLDELVEALQLPRDQSRHPLFEIEVILQQQDTSLEALANDLPGLQLEAFEEGRFTTARFDLVFEFVETTEGLRAQLVYNSDLYTSVMATQFLQHVHQLLVAVTANPYQPVNQLAYLTQEEQQQLLTTFNNTAIAYPAHKTILSLFEEQAILIPDAPALVNGNVTLTYRQLDEKANQLAHYLRNTYAVLPDEIIGILLDRSEKLIIAILGILKAGAAYVPLDSGFPRSRKEFICNDARLRILLTQTDYLFDLDFFNGQVFALDVQADNLDTPITPTGIRPALDHLAYLIYTSGSTGEPKGVMIEHGTIVNTIQSQCTLFEAQEGEHHLQFASCSFDASVSEIFVALCAGAILYLIEEEERKDPQKLEAFIQAHRIDLATIPPAYLKWLNIEKIASLRKLVTAGEAAVADKVAAFLKTGRYFNAYGPTETSICATIFPVAENVDSLAENIPIGKPIANTQIYITDPFRNLVAIGVPGEMYIGGAGLARGYLNREALTAQKFIPHPFRDHDRLYHTGDLARWLPDGNIEFIGRSDNQVKIRGYRVELGEIEQALQSHPDIEAAAVITRLLPDGEREIIAYLAGRQAAAVTDPSAWLAQRLPVYMLPAFYVPLEQLPLTPAGKLDRKALPRPELAGLTDRSLYTPPRDAVEQQLVAIWQEILGKERIGIGDDFFELGGHSLRATRLVSLLHRTFEIKIELKDIFAVTRLEDQANLIRQARRSSFRSIPVVPAASAYELSSSQKRLWLLSQFKEHNRLYNVPAAYLFAGSLSREGLMQAFNKILARHESLRTIFRETEPGQVKQYIQAPGDTRFSIGYFDMRTVMANDHMVKEAVAHDFYEPFDLATGPLLRANLYQLKEEQWVFTYTMHHIISDGWSMDIFIRELLQYYQAFLQQTELELPPLRTQYKDYAAWQQDQLGEAPMQQQKNWWLEQLASPLPVLTLTENGKRPAIKTYEGDTVQHTMEAGIIAGFHILVRDQGATLFMGLLAAVNMLLYHRTKQQDIIIGTPVAGRQHSDLDQQIGFYINTLPLRTRFRPDQSFSELLASVKAVTLGAYENQAWPFDELVEALRLERDSSRNVLFDTWMVLHNVGVRTLGREHHPQGLTITAYPHTPGLLTKFDLQFNFEETGNGLLTDIEYNTAILTRTEARTLGQELEHILRLIQEDPSITPGAISGLLTQRARQEQQQQVAQLRKKNLASLKTKE